MVSTRQHSRLSNSTTSSMSSAVVTAGTMSDFESLTPSDNVDHRNTMGDPRPMALRPRLPAEAASLKLELHPIHSSESLLISVKTPRLPAKGLERASCDIVVVIDISGSMSAAAPLPDTNDAKERDSAGLSILDLVKYATRTVLETLKDGDRFGIVTFSDDARVVQPLTNMTKAAKEATRERIEALTDDGCTNLWAGIRTGLTLFEKADLVGNVQGMYVLTDGQPNHMCPKQGYVAKLKPMMAQAAKQRAVVPSIHTFGFGYAIRSELMQSIAEVGDGSYAFIPDAGMIGTVFVHAVANLFVTAATAATLELKTSGSIFSRSLKFEAPAGITAENTSRGISLRLGNLQYGQSRDVLVTCPGISPTQALTATLSYTLPDGSAHGSQAQTLWSQSTGISQEQVDYHSTRTQLCQVLTSLFPYYPNGEHRAVTEEQALTMPAVQLTSLAEAIKVCPSASSPLLQSLYLDIAGDAPHGQITEALKYNFPTNYWTRWGRHYLPSLLHAHQRQQCNTFKDPGPLMYGAESPLFKQCRTELDTAFDSLPPPTASRLPMVEVSYVAPDGSQRKKMSKAKTNVRMSRYHDANNPCFAGSAKVTMADGSVAPIKDLRVGMQVWSPFGPRRVAAVLRTRVPGHHQLCRVGNLVVTPWHPVKIAGEWVFPHDVADSTVRFSGSVYSVLLAPAKHADAHVIKVGGQVAVTLGHGVTNAAGDARSHAFFGNYKRVSMALARLRTDKNGHMRGAGLQRDVRTKLAVGFVRAGLKTATVVNARRGVSFCNARMAVQC